ESSSDICFLVHRLKSSETVDSDVRIAVFFFQQETAYELGVIWCCAAGNEVRTVVAPAVFPGTIAVAASNPKDKEWEGSSRGDRVDITAPGQDVYVPVWNQRREEDFCFGSGTSYATPHIAAAAAAWLAAHQKALSSSDYRGWRR